MIAWSDGRGRNPPEWVIDLQLAELWHIPPWEIDEGHEIWIERAKLFALYPPPAKEKE